MIGEGLILIFFGILVLMGKVADQVDGLYFHLPDKYCSFA
jgi:hypothetical protein